MEPQQLAARNELIMLDLIFGGLTLTTAADKHGLDVNTLRVIRKSPMWKKRERELLDERKAEYEMDLNAMVKPAMEGLTELSKKMIDVPNPEGGSDSRPNPPQVRLSAVREILDRARVGGDSVHQPALVNINMYAPPWARKPGEEEKDTMTITFDPDKGGR